MSYEKVTLTQALENVTALDDLIMPNEQPCIEALSLSIQYRADFDTNFEDQNAFVSSVAKYKEQATIQAYLNSLLEEGEEFAVMLYTWRCCSRSFPQVKDNMQKNRSEIYENIVNVLEPLANKLLEFMRFQGKAIELFCNEVLRLCHKEKKDDFVSETYLLTLGKIINMTAELDELKNMKASVRNDYAAYRRAVQFLRAQTDSEMMENSQRLSMNLGTQNQIRDSMKLQLANISGFEELLADVVNICVVMYEKGMYLNPSEKHMLVKAMAFGLALIDSNKGPTIYRMKKLNLGKIDRILKENEMVPLYGDMMTAPYNYIKKSPNFDPSKWPCCESSNPSPQSNLLVCLDQIRDRHRQYISELAVQNNLAAKVLEESIRSDEENAKLARLALDGLQLMSLWTQKVMDLYCWKLMNPTDSHNNKDCPDTAEEYERATRYNYNKQEKFALVEIIAMIKGLQLMMFQMEPVFQEAIQRHIYAELQEFAQCFLREPLRRAAKKNQDTIRILILSVRDTCVDWQRGLEPADDPALSGKKDPSEGFHIKVPRRNVGPSSTQLYMIRTMLESLTDERHGGKKTMRKEMNEHHVTAIEEFLEKSFSWKYLLNFSDSLFNCGDLSQLWFREFFLEMTMGKRIQFPIEMSMPWILTDHILETKEPSMMEYILYPLDLYNDSAQFSLMKFRKQFLYDEVEAEVNLCFDQVVYKLSDQIFAYYKHLAGCILLDKKFHEECRAMRKKINYPKANRYQTLMQQRHVQLLGRSVDLTKLIGPLVNVALQRALDVAICRFEAGSLMGIMELEGLIEVNRLAHKLMGEYLLLNDFNAMLKEANHNVSAPYGRITLHVFWEINKELLPHYCYNATTSRFVKSKFPHEYETKRDKAPNLGASYVWGTKELNQSFSTIYSLFSGFIGAPHFQAICRLLGYQGIALVVEELLKTVNTIITGPTAQYVATLTNVLPGYCKLPRFDYTSSGILGYYQAHLVDLIAYAELRTAVFQNFTEFGNVVLFVLLIEQALNQEEVFDLKHAAPYRGLIPKPHVTAEDKKEKEKATKQALDELQKKYSNLNLVSVAKKTEDSELIDLHRESDLLTKERLCCGLAIFKKFLEQIKSFLIPSWYGDKPKNGVMNVERCSEFHRLWSAIQFIYCIPTGEHEFTIEEMYGEGLHWAGCTLIMLLGQHNRFEVLDFCYHLLKVNNVDQMDEKVSGISLRKMMGRIRKFQILNNQIFSVLKKYMSDFDDEGNPVKKPAQDFEPPVYECEASSA